MTMTYAKNIENAVLSSFVFGTMIEMYPKYFKLDALSFTTPLKRKLAAVINTELEQEQPTIDYVITQFEESLKSHEQDEFLDILSQTPLNMETAKKYHQDLIAKRVKRENDISNTRRVS